MTESPTIDPRMYRDVIGRFATGVTVITFKNDEVVRGMTANAVTSLSLDPTLLIICVDNKATACPQMEKASAFAVNILAEDQIEVSKTFARHGVEDMADVAYTSGVTGSPIIDNSLAWVDCEIQERLPGGDHTIYIGRVVDLSLARPDAEPLLFFGGGYRKLGGTL